MTWVHPVAGNSRCEGNQVFVKEADVVIRGAREMARTTAGSLTECTDYCRSDHLNSKFSDPTALI